MSKTGRPQKLNADYFSHDSDASADEKIIYLESLFGDSGYAWYFKMLETLTRADNFEIEWSEIKSAILARKFNADPARFAEFIVGATSPEIRAFCINNGKLYSEGLKKRLGVVTERRAKEAERMAKLRQKEAENDGKGANTEQSFQNQKPENQSVKNGLGIVGATSTIVDATTPHSKVKKSKVKYSKVKNSSDDVTTPPPPLFNESESLKNLSNATADFFASPDEGSLDFQKIEKFRAAFEREMKTTGKKHESESDLIQHFIFWVRKKSKGGGAQAGPAPSAGVIRRAGVNDIRMTEEDYNRPQYF